MPLATSSFRASVIGSHKRLKQKLVERLALLFLDISSAVERLRLLIAYFQLALDSLQLLRRTMAIGARWRRYMAPRLKWFHSHLQLVNSNLLILRFMLNLRSSSDN